MSFSGMINTKRMALSGLLCGILAAGSYAEEDMSDALKAPDNVAAAPADASKTASGLASVVLQPGDGKEMPKSYDKVTVHYTGWTTDGTMFDSSVKRGQPATFPLNGVIKGWTEGLQLMSKGEKRRFWIPADLAYGENPGGGRPGGQLVFDVELLEIEKGEAPPEAPADVKEIPEEKTESGIASKILKEGEGESPSGSDIVEMHFSAWNTDGEFLESSRKQPSAAKFPLNQVFPGFSEGLAMMKKGEQRRFWMPAAVAGPFARGAGEDGMLVFDFELIDFKKAVPPPAAPADVAAAPADAEKTESGLASKVLQKGTGTEKPKPTDTVSVHYTGWETNGEMFDSSVTRGEPTSFPLNQVIPGWTEGVGLMVVGEKRRFWIPEDLAYGPKQEGSGRPGGLLVFDVELLEIK